MLQQIIVPIVTDAGSTDPRQVPILWAAFSIICGISYLILAITWFFKYFNKPYKYSYERNRSTKLMKNYVSSDFLLH